MATKLFLNRISSPVKAGYLELRTVMGNPGSTDLIVNTAAGGTEIQWTFAAGSTILSWISPPLAAGLTLTTADISIRANESHVNANCGGRCRIFRRTPDGTETELGGGPFNDGVEFTTSWADYLWTCDFTDTAFNAGDRILLKVFITNIGTMGGGYTCAGGAGYTTRYLNFTAETPTFLPESARPGTHLLLGVGG